MPSTPFEGLGQLGSAELLAHVTGADVDARLVLAEEVHAGLRTLAVKASPPVFEAAVEGLAELLAANFGIATSGPIYAAAADLGAMVADPKGLEKARARVGSLVDELADLGHAVTPAIAEDHARYLAVAYRLGLTETTEPLGWQAAFTLADRDALHALDTSGLWWVGEHYGDALDTEKILATVKTTMLEQGLGRVEAGRRLAAVMGDQVKRSDVYWQGLAATVATRSRSFGALEGMRRVGAVRYEFVNPVDERTSDVCRSLDGTVFTVKGAIQLRDRLLEQADTPEAWKAISPWPKPEDLVDENGARLKPSALQAKGIAWPPLHFHCRSAIEVRVWQSLGADEEDPLGHVDPKAYAEEQHAAAKKPKAPKAPPGITPSTGPVTPSAPTPHPSAPPAAVPPAVKPPPVQVVDLVPDPVGPPPWKPKIPSAVVDVKGDTSPVDVLTALRLQGYTHEEIAGAGEPFFKLLYPKPKREALLAWLEAHPPASPRFLPEHLIPDVDAWRAWRVLHEVGGEDEGAKLYTDAFDWLKGLGYSNEQATALIKLDPSAELLGILHPHSEIHPLGMSPMDVAESLSERPPETWVPGPKPYVWQAPKPAPVAPVAPAPPPWKPPLLPYAVAHPPEGVDLFDELDAWLYLNGYTPEELTELTAFDYYVKLDEGGWDAVEAFFAAHPPANPKAPPDWADLLNPNGWQGWQAWHAQDYAGLVEDLGEVAPKVGRKFYEGTRDALLARGYSDDQIYALIGHPSPGWRMPKVAKLAPDDGGGVYGVYALEWDLRKTYHPETWQVPKAPAPTWTIDQADEITKANLAAGHPLDHLTGSSYPPKVAAQATPPPSPVAAAPKGVAVAPVPVPVPAPSGPLPPVAGLTVDTVPKGPVVVHAGYGWSPKPPPITTAATKSKKTWATWLGKQGYTDEEIEVVWPELEAQVLTGSPGAGLKGHAANQAKAAAWGPKAVGYLEDRPPGQVVSMVPKPSAFVDPVELGARLQGADFDVPEDLGQAFEDAVTGDRFFVRYHATEGQARAEVAAQALYRRLGVEVGEARLVNQEGRLGVATPAFSGWERPAHVDHLAELAGDKLAQECPADFFLGNWNVVGSGTPKIYTRKTAGGAIQTLRTDNAGVLGWRASGSEKPFGSDVPEFVTMLKPEKAAGQAFARARESGELMLPMIDRIAALTDADLDAALTLAGYSGDELAQVGGSLRGRRDWFRAQATAFRVELKERALEQAREAERLAGAAARARERAGQAVALAGSRTPTRQLDLVALADGLDQGPVAVQGDGSSLNRHQVRVQRYVFHADDALASRVREEGFIVYLQVTSDKVTDVADRLSRAGATREGFAAYGRVGGLSRRTTAAEPALHLFETGDASTRNFLGNSYRRTLPDSDLHYSAPSVGGNDAMKGRIRIMIKTSDPAQAQAILERELRTLGLSEALRAPTEDEDLIMRANAYLWNRQGASFRPVTDRAAALAALKKEEIKPADLVVETFNDGYHRVRAVGQDAEIRKKTGVGWLYTQASGRPDSMASMFGWDGAGGGTKSTTERYLGGVIRTGMSSGPDLGTGGANSVFFRAVPNGSGPAVGRGAGSSWYSHGKSTLIIRTDELERADWYAFTHDSYGDHVGSTWATRQRNLDTIKTAAGKSGALDNEIMFAHGVGRESFVVLSASTPADRARYLEAFRDAGVTHIRGEPVSDFVVLMETPHDFTHLDSANPWHRYVMGLESSVPDVPWDAPPGALRTRKAAELVRRWSP